MRQIITEKIEKIKEKIGENEKKYLKAMEKFRKFPEFPNKDRLTKLNNRFWGHHNRLKALEGLLESADKTGSEKEVKQK